MRAEFRAHYGLDADFVVGCVGRIKWVRKGQEFLVEATALLKKRGITIKALIVGATFPGNEDHLDRLRALIAQRSIADRVVLTGELTDPRAAYSAMDALALTSAQPEPFGNVVMEAMGMGLPVIATAIGGSIDQVVDGITGYLVPAANPEALADAIERLVRSRGLRTKMGAAGFSRVREQFSLEQMSRKLEDLFETVMDGTTR